MFLTLLASQGEALPRLQGDIVCYQQISLFIPLVDQSPPSIARNNTSLDGFMLGNDEIHDDSDRDSGPNQNSHDLSRAGADMSEVWKSPRLRRGGDRANAQSGR